MVIDIKEEQLGPVISLPAFGGGNILDIWKSFSWPPYLSLHQYLPRTIWGNGLSSGLTKSAQHRQLLSAVGGRAEDLRNAF